MPKAKILILSLKGKVRDLPTMLIRPYPLKETILANGAKASFFAPNVNPFIAPFIDMKSLNGYLLHHILEFKGFAFVSKAFIRLPLGIS